MNNNYADLSARITCYREDTHKTFTTIASAVSYQASRITTHIALQRNKDSVLMKRIVALEEKLKEAEEKVEIAGQGVYALMQVRKERHSLREYCVDRKQGRRDYDGEDTV